MRFFDWFRGKRSRSQEYSAEVAAHIPGVINQGLRQYASEMKVRVQGTSVKIADAELEVLPFVERRLKQDGKHLCAVRMEVSPAAAPQMRFTYGTIGIDDSIKGAEQTAVVEWFLAFGLPLMQSFARSNTALRVNNYKVYPGVMGTRGDPPEDWAESAQGIDERVLTALHEHLDRLAAPVSILDLKLAIAPDGKVDGECRVDGAVSTEVLEALQKLPWPRAAQLYLWKQVYVLKQQT